MTRTLRIALIQICFVTAATATLAQAPAQPQPAATAAPTATLPAAHPEDVSSPDAIIAAVYNVISGPAGQKRDWDRMRSLFYPGARLIPTSPKKEGGGNKATTLTPQEYIDRGGAYLEKNGFSEREISHHTEAWGNIQQIFSTYESRHDPKDEKPFARGINSFQLFNDGSRWWIITIYWQQESSELPIPAEYLPQAH
jgi:hypothetical protein